MSQTLILNDPASASGHVTVTVGGHVTPGGGGGGGYHFAASDDLALLHDRYFAIHGCLATGVCIFGVVVNVLNVIVLTRKKMLSPTNLLLTALAVADGITMVLYLPFVIYYYLIHDREPTPQKNSLRATVMLQLYAWCSVVSHTTSIWITVALAIFRCGILNTVFQSINYTNTFQCI